MPKQKNKNKKPAPKAPVKDINYSFKGDIAEIIKANAKLHRTLIEQSPDLRGIHRKFIGAALNVTLADVKMLARISIKDVVFESLDDTTDMQAPDKTTIKIPAKLTTNIDKEGAAALKAVIRDLNILLTKINEASQNYLKNTPIIRPNLRGTAGRALAEVIQNISRMRSDVLEGDYEAEVQAGEAQDVAEQIALVHEATDARFEYAALMQRASR